MSFWKQSSIQGKYGSAPAVVSVITTLAVVAVLSTGCYVVLPPPTTSTTARPAAEPAPTQPLEVETTDIPDPEPTQPPQPEARPPTAVMGVSQEGVTQLADAGAVLVPAGQTVYYMGTASSPGSSPITSYEWDFGAGKVAEGEVVPHTFNAPGLYTVTLTVTDENGESNTAVHSILVEYWH